MARDPLSDAASHHRPDAASRQNSKATTNAAAGPLTQKIAFFGQKSAANELRPPINPGASPIQAAPMISRISSFAKAFRFNTAASQGASNATTNSIGPSITNSSQSSAPCRQSESSVDNIDDDVVFVSASVKSVSSSSGGYASSTASCGASKAANVKAVDETTSPSRALQRLEQFNVSQNYGKGFNQFHKAAFTGTSVPRPTGIAGAATTTMGQFGNTAGRTSANNAQYAHAHDAQYAHAQGANSRHQFMNKSTEYRTQFTSNTSKYFHSKNEYNHAQIHSKQSPHYQRPHHHTTTQFNMMDYHPGRNPVRGLTRNSDTTGYSSGNSVAARGNVDGTFGDGMTKKRPFDYGYDVDDVSTTQENKRNKHQTHQNEVIVISDVDDIPVPQSVPGSGPRLESGASLEPKNTEDALKAIEPTVQDDSNTKIEPINITTDSQVKADFQAKADSQVKAEKPKPKSKRTLPPSLTQKKTESLQTMSDRVKKKLEKKLYKGKEAKIELSGEQKVVFDRAVNLRRNIFYTGRAGTGKSLLLRRIIAALKDHYYGNGNKIGITAPTGKAACNIGGCTIHSFAGIGLGNGTAPSLLDKVKKNKRALQRWRDVNVLVIDEVSMLDGDLLDKLEFIARSIRKNPKPFGGIQIILTGDFFQLPPVGSTTKFAFEAKCWEKILDDKLEMTQVFRQKDPTFVKILNEVRMGVVSEETERVLMSLSREPQYPNDGIEPTCLFSRRDQVDRANSSRLQALPGETTVYTASDHGDEPHISKLRKDCIAPDQVSLKVGAQVMLIKNLTDVLVNGSVGIIIGFRGVSVLPESEDDAQNVGLTTGPLLPLVRFENGLETIIEQQTWDIEMPGIGVVASRSQGIQTAECKRKLIGSLTFSNIGQLSRSIHKSQGQTLSRVKVDLSTIFECGQAYVALSRATSLEGLQVLGFHRSKIKVNPKVIVFVNALTSVHESILLNVKEAPALASLAGPSSSSSLKSTKSRKKKDTKESVVMILD